MKHLVQHLIKHNLDEIVSKSILHCHCKGLHSIMFNEAPEKTIRLYIAVPEHEMWRNHPTEFKTNDMSIGFHAHHCHVTLHCVYGEIWNWVVEPDKEANIELIKYRYHSKISKGDLKFEKLGTEKLKSLGRQYICQDDSVQMWANEIHTVCCEKGKLSAWFVYEGTEDKNYDNVLWTNTDLNAQDHTGLYQKPTKQQVVELLQMVELI